MNLQKFLPPFFTLRFLQLCLSSFLFFASFNMIIPELPAYLTSLGGEDYKGLIISLFTLTAGLSRPFSGKLADRIGRVPVMIFGAGVCLVVSLLYPLISGVAGFLCLRFLHGFSTGFTPTGISAYVADIVPFNRRGEAMGLQSLFSSLGMAAGPALGGYIASIHGITPLFYCSSGVALVSILLLIRLKETVPETEAFHVGHFKLKKDELFEKSVLSPCFVLFFSYLSFGIILTIIPDFSASLNIANKGIFFAVFTLSSLAIRLLAGRASDRYGRIPVLKAATFCLAMAMTATAFSHTKEMLVFSGILFGFSLGMTSPTIAAWTIDLSLSKFRGRGLATMYIALEAGIGIGALGSGWVYGNQQERFPLVFLLGTAGAIIAFIYLFITKTASKSPQNDPASPVT
ncbi:MFS transporter [Echinicola vietnamensis]|uniref:Arabinose efflux permease family protein n=1 Tax=Echinicola vietnamensis (strain DSM 17526 / LMG 23754 / KMM 6221) TaxID=926556 RepID=L0FYS2_ECHVK|nr:MFS transporter [Echinicola vietnamensis]AGA78447.1 arabinose efflux permease family protein [Echinicola vietnamensis DSM 17526]